MSKRLTDGPDGESPASQSAGAGAVSGSDDTAFERLLHEAARVFPSGRMLAAGTRLCAGRFEIVRRIGEGGMGVVYQALDSARSEKVALKTLLQLEANDVYRLKNEFRALADVSHPNLVGLHELFGDAGLWFFSMDLVDGERFDQWVRPDGACSEARLRAAVPQLLRAANAIHGAGKLHRDFKPSNVLVTSEGRPEPCRQNTLSAGCRAPARPPLRTNAANGIGPSWRPFVSAQRTRMSATTRCKNSCDGRSALWVLSRLVCLLAASSMCRLLLGFEVGDGAQVL